MHEIDFIHRYLPGTGGSQRVLLLLHGTGGDESDLIPLGRELDANAALLSPRGKISEHGSARFFRRFAEGLFDEADVIQRANELADFVRAAAEQYQFDADKVIAVGYSNGANIAAAILLLRPEAFGGAILFRAMVPLSKPPPGGDLKGKPVLVSAGAADPIIPPENAQRLASSLEERGAAISFRLQEASHGLVREDLVAAKEWLTQRSN
jgi:phospholipase/carboxylesterase